MEGSSLLFGELPVEQAVWMSHGDSITRLPDGFASTAHTDSTPFAGLQAPERNLFGIQFPWARGTITAEGRTIRGVGLRYAGNASYMSSAGGLKRSFLVDLARAEHAEFHGLHALPLPGGALDPDDRVIYVGSVSKTLAPGLRLGFMVAAPDFIAEARALRRLTVRHPPTNNQRAVALFLQLGHHDAAIKRLIAAYRERAAAIGEGLRRYLPEAEFHPPSGGAVLWAEGPRGISMDAVAATGTRHPRRSPTFDRAARSIQAVARSG